ncbi:MAG: 30S ribosome-binding factor RbfA [Clostridiales bacterium]|jgi:ribosome-binding factor A|nr:30S ribosome-binding factor RbfA [Clostridiales bacterium]
MARNKLYRINSDIAQTLSELLREIKDPRVRQGMISVTGAETTNDLKICNVYVSVFGLEDEKEFLKGLKSASGYLRRELGSRLKLRNVPELFFHLDRSIERGAHINAIISELDIPREEDDGVPSNN